MAKGYSARRGFSGGGGMAQQQAQMQQKLMKMQQDMAKAQEFVFSQLGLATDYSIKGQLLGHLVMGAQDAAETAARLGVPEEKSVLVQHLILSHHGEPEFGAAVRPLCAEAELLSLIDAVDSRMEIYRETYDRAGHFQSAHLCIGEKGVQARVGS